MNESSLTELEIIENSATLSIPIARTSHPYFCRKSFENLSNARPTTPGNNKNSKKKGNRRKLKLEEVEYLIDLLYR